MNFSDFSFNAISKILERAGKVKHIYDETSFQHTYIINDFLIIKTRLNDGSWYGKW